MANARENLVRAADELTDAAKEKVREAEAIKGGEQAAAIFKILRNLNSTHGPRSVRRVVRSVAAFYGLAVGPDEDLLRGDSDKDEDEEEKEKTDGAK